MKDESFSSFLFGLLAISFFSEIREIREFSDAILPILIAKE